MKLRIVKKTDGMANEKFEIQKSEQSVEGIQWRRASPIMKRADGGDLPMFYYTLDDAKNDLPYYDESLAKEEVVWEQ